MSTNILIYPTSRPLVLGEDWKETLSNIVLLPVLSGEFVTIRCLTIATVAQVYSYALPVEWGEWLDEEACSFLSKAQREYGVATYERLNPQLQSFKHGDLVYRTENGLEPLDNLIRAREAEESQRLQRMMLRSPLPSHDEFIAAMSEVIG